MASSTKTPLASVVVVRSEIIDIGSLDALRRSWTLALSIGSPLALSVTRPRSVVDLIGMSNVLEP